MNLVLNIYAGAMFHINPIFDIIWRKKLSYKYSFKGFALISCNPIIHIFMGIGFLKFRAEQFSFTFCILSVSKLLNALVFILINKNLQIQSFKQFVNYHLQYLYFKQFKTTIWYNTWNFWKCLLELNLCSNNFCKLLFDAKL